MNRFKEFMSRMTKKGWAIIIGVVLVVVLLIAAGVHYAKNPDAWTAFFDRVSDVQVAKKEDKNQGDDRKKEDKFADKAADSIFKPVTPPVPAGSQTGHNPYSVTPSTPRNTRLQEVKVAVVIDEDKYKGIKLNSYKDLSCGRITYVTAWVQGPGVLNSAYQDMFAARILADFEPNNIIPKYHPNLRFKEARLQDGTLRVYLTGSFGESQGQCGKDLAMAQITETAFLFDNVLKAEIHLYGDVVYTTSN